MKIFLEGEKNIGKSTLISSVFSEIKDKSGGFVSQKILTNGEITSFSLARTIESLSPAIKHTDETDNLFMEKSEHHNLIKDGVFEKWAENNFYLSGNEAFIILDEIGGVELFNERFTQKILSLIKSPLPCIGVIKSYKNAVKLSQKIRNSTEYLQKYTDFREKIKQHSIIIELKKENYEENHDLLLQIKNRILKQSCK